MAVSCPASMCWDLALLMVVQGPGEAPGCDGQGEEFQRWVLMLLKQRNEKEWITEGGRSADTG